MISTYFSLLVNTYLHSLKEFHNLCWQILYLFDQFHITPSFLREIMKKCAPSMVATRKCNVGVAMLAWLIHFFLSFQFSVNHFCLTPSSPWIRKSLTMQYNQEVKIVWTSLKVECQLLEGPVAKKKGMWHKLEDLWHQEAPPVFPSRKLDLAWGVEEFVKAVEGLSSI